MCYCLLLTFKYLSIFLSDIVIVYNFYFLFYLNVRINSYTLFDTFPLSFYFVDFYSKWLVWLLIPLAKKLLIWFSCKEAKTFNFYVNNWLTYSYLSHICFNQVKITKIHFHFSTNLLTLTIPLPGT